MSRLTAAQRAIVRERDRILREAGDWHDIESSDFPDEMLLERARPTEHAQDHCDYVDLLRDTVRFSRIGGDQRTVVDLRVDGFSFTEISAATGISRRKCWQYVQDTLTLARQKTVDRGEEVAVGLITYHKKIYNRNNTKCRTTQANHLKTQAEEAWTAQNVSQMKTRLPTGRIPKFYWNEPLESSEPTSSTSGTERKRKAG